MRSGGWRVNDCERLQRRLKGKEEGGRLRVRVPHTRTTPAAAGVVRVCGIVLRVSTVLAETVAAGPRSRPRPRTRPRARAVLGVGSG